MTEDIRPNPEALNEALSLSGEILRNIELSEISLTSIALKASRLARLLNDFEMQKALEYETAGYPSSEGGMPRELWDLAVKAGRNFIHTEIFTKKKSVMVYTASIGSLEETLRTTEAALAAARDPEVPGPVRKGPLGSDLAPGNVIERRARLESANEAAGRLSGRRSFIYQYVLRRHYELKYSSIAGDAFSRVRERVDATVGEVIPDSVKRFAAVYDNLRSDNPEDWSNAVHSCRRILQDLADAVFPPSGEVREIKRDGKVQQIKLGVENYVNRIISFIQDKSESDRFRDVVGSHLVFLGDRLDSIVEAANKGTHTTIVSREEADRYVVYTYMLVGDILTLTS